MYLTGWWFGCHFLNFPMYWVANHPNWRTHIFQRGGPTTNQLRYEKLQALFWCLSHPIPRLTIPDPTALNDRIVITFKLNEAATRSRVAVTSWPMVPTGGCGHLLVIKGSLARRLPNYERLSQPAVSPSCQPHHLVNHIIMNQPHHHVNHIIMK